ncbi:MAG: YebC/PmpR family DNA-binding transcriptional regulator [Planctomycetaceae bacterium]|jgi:YebC/PmpR family DNA-binding regulatory protein|nr:YebC/PmpR family DNA-binding transcriptional regulator [Planctomycetaceae bacterium]
MSGHSHWAGIKHKKALVDAKRGKLWSKLAKAIIIAAKSGGDPEANFKLRAAIDAAKAVSLPKENITRAIKTGTGELKGADLEEIVYEGYGPDGVAVYCEALTDNRNRTAPEIRKIFERGGGKLGATGCVAWNFEKKGLFLIPRSAMDEEKLMELMIEAGAEDFKAVEDSYEITCQPENYQSVSDAVAASNLTPEVSELSFFPKDSVDIMTRENAAKVLQLMEMLDEHEDIQNVSSNFNIPDELMAELEK